MLKPQLVLSTCTAGTAQLLQNLHEVFEQAGTRDPFHWCQMSALSLGLLQLFHRDVIWSISVFWEWRFPPEFMAATGGVNLAFQTLLALIQDGLAWWKLSLELPAGLF